MKRGAILRSVISLLCLAAVLFSLRGKLTESVLILRHEVSWSWFFLAVVTQWVGIILITFRLEMIFKVKGLVLNFWEVLYLNFVGLFFNLFFPSAVGGDIAKAYYAYKHSGKKLESTTAVILDRLMGFIALIIIALIAVWAFSRQLDDNRLSSVIYISLFVMAGVLFFLTNKRFARLFKFLQILIPSAKWKERLSGLYHDIYDYKRHKSMLALSIGLSFLSQTFFIMVQYWVARSLGVHLSPWLFFILVPAVAFISMAPSIGGLGVREAGVIYLFKHYMPAQRAFAMGLLLDMIIYGYSIFAGFLFALKGGLKAKVIHEMEEIQ